MSDSLLNLNILRVLTAIRLAWGPDTGIGEGVAPGSPVGQCAVTALLVQDVLGGEIVRGLTTCGSHYWNRVPGMGDVDLTREQYGADVEIDRGDVVARSRLLEGDRALAARRTPPRARLCPRSGRSPRKLRDLLHSSWFYSNAF